ncbi:iron-sulfur cluster assembly scaffold protein [Sphingobium sp. AP50]|uniref:iron-sulfur cluster assembly scaffold protein n=1 Tax=Sphingobium sp. AP50 TaxID=1884369 RepID=UPI001160CCF9|nr:iron-sulfur cluster assembly scaffold protein [Sphingobium sp. AP50]
MRSVDLAPTTRASALYSAEILQLAVNIPHHRRLEMADGSAERRSPICGSRVIVDITLDPHVRIRDLGMEVRACALGQASAALMSTHAIGRSLEEVIASRDALACYLGGTRSDPGPWPKLDLFASARAYPARHASISLCFEAMVDAMNQALLAGRRCPPLSHHGSALPFTSLSCARND